MSGVARSLTDVPEAEEEALTPTSPSLLHYPVSPSLPPPSITVVSASSSARSSSSALKNRTPSIRTLGRSSSENMPGTLSGPTTPTTATAVPTTAATSNGSSSSSTNAGSSSSSTTKRSSSSSSSSKTRGARPPPPLPSSSSHHLPIKFKSIPSLPHDKNAEIVPATSMHWSRAPVYGSIPQSTMRGHSVTVVDNIAWLIGGGHDDKDSGRDMKNMYCFDTETMQWTIRETTGDIPPSSRAHTTTLVDRKLIIVGGGHSMQYYDKVYVLDTTTRHWTQPIISPGPTGTPTPRRAHSAVLYRNKIWIFGGGTGLTALNDVWTLDISSTSRMKWEEVRTTGRTPKQRGYHTANLVGSYMVVMGGSDGKEFFTDTWCLDLNTLKWSQVSLLTNKYKRIAHSATQVGSFLFIIGGYNGEEYCSDVLPFNLTSLSYEPRITYGRPPSGRAYHATILSDSRLFLFGGFDGVTAYDDVYILDLSAGAYLPQVTSFTIEI